MNTQNVALAHLLTSQAEETNQADQDRMAEIRAMFDKSPKGTKAHRQPKAPKERKLKALKAEKEVINLPKSAPPPWAVIEPGSVQAEGFLKMSRTAKNRNEAIAAIHAYIGYDMAKDFGTQEYQAKATAARELKPIVYQAKTQATVQGFVAGMPNGGEKFRQNLKARERVAVEGIIEHTKAAEGSTNEFDTTLHTGLAQVEAERIRQIRMDLDQARGVRHTMIGLG